MTEVEVLENYWNTQNAGIGVLSLFISVFSAYLLVAYLVGAKLTKFQFLFISSAFTIFELVCCWGTAVYFGEGYQMAMALEQTHPKLSVIPLDPTWIFLPLLLLGIIGALKFMWDIRKSNTN
jgi:hypothetical protein